MKKKGFTLVELLAVLTLLGILTLIVFPPIINRIKSTRGRISEATLNLIYNAAEIHVKEDVDQYPLYKDDTYCVVLNTLVEEGKINPPLEDSSGKEISLSKIVKLEIGENQKITYSLVEEGQCNETPQPVRDGLVFWFDNDYRGTIANQWFDSSGNGYNGTIVGATWTSEGLYFDGKDDYVDIAPYNTDVITLEAYFKIKTFPSRYNRVLTNIAGGGHSMMMNQKIIVGQTYINNAWPSVHNIKDAELDTFYHVVYTYDGSVQRLYIDGNEVRNLTVTGTLKNPDGNVHWALGAQPNHAEPFNGTIHTARLYNRALTAEEVKRNYDATT